MLRENPPPEPEPYTAPEPKESKEETEEEKDETAGDKEKAEEDKEQKVLEAIEGEMTLSRIVEATKMDEGDVSKILEELCDKGDVFEPKPGKYRRV